MLNFQILNVVRDYDLFEHELMQYPWCDSVTDTPLIVRVRERFVHFARAYFSDNHIRFVEVK